MPQSADHDVHRTRQDGRINAAQGFIHTLIDGAASDEAIRTRFLNKAAKSLDGLENLVQDLLMLSHIETGEIRMKMDPVDMSELAHEIVVV